MKTYNFINDIKCNERNIEYAKYIDHFLEEKKKLLKTFFETDKDLKYNVYLYDKIEDLIIGLKNRGFGEHPNYMCACHKDFDNSINYFEPIDEYQENEWCKKEYDLVIFHESIHSFQYSLYGSKEEWLNEGIAKLLDNEYTKSKIDLIREYVNINELPNINELQGNTFCTDKYNGYILSYLMVSYLIDVYGKSKFLKIISDDEKIKELSIDLLKNTIDYYTGETV